MCPELITDGIFVHCDCESKGILCCSVEMYNFEEPSRPSSTSNFALEQPTFAK